MFDRLVRRIVSTGKAYRCLELLAQLVQRRGACSGQAAEGKSLSGPGAYRSSHRPAARAAAVALSVCLMVTAMPPSVFKAEAGTGTETGLCRHHPAHTTGCGYQEAKTGHPCGHKVNANVNANDVEADREGRPLGGGHTEDCYTDELICGYSADGDATASGSDANHTHTQDCYAQDCPHERGEHKGGCGYVEGVKGSPCGYVCELCDKQDHNTGMNNGIETITVTSFRGLDEEVQRQTVPAGTPVESLVLPDTLHATAQTGDADGEPVVIEVVIWEPDAPYEGAAGRYVFTASAQGYVPAQGVDWPVITVTVEEGAPTLAEIDALCAAIDALPTMDELYENAPGDSEQEFAAWVSDTRALLSEVPKLWERLSALKGDQAAMARITQARADKLAELNDLATRLRETLDIATVDALNTEITNSSGTAEEPTVITIGASGITVDKAITIDNKHVKLTGGALTRAESYGGNLIEVKNGGSLTLESITLDGNKQNGVTANGSLIYAVGKSNDTSLVTTLNLGDGVTLKNNRTAGNGGAVRLTDNGGAIDFTMTRGEITGNIASSGGAIYEAGFGTATVRITGGEITGNTANGTDPDSTYGGAVYSNGALIIEGGTITGNNTANGRGGGIFKTGGTDKEFTVTGGVISGNAARESDHGGDNVYVNQCAFTLGGAADIPDGLYLKLRENSSVKSTFTISSALQNPVGIEEFYSHPQVGDLVATGTLDYTITDDDLAKFSYESGEFSFALDENQIKLAAPTSSVHTHDMSVECGSTNPIIFDKTLAADTIIINTSGNYYLGSDVTITNSPLTIAGENVEVSLCLNGHTLSPGSASSEVILIENGATLNLCDCRPDASNSTSINDPVTGNAVNITGGLITGGTTDNLAGGGVSCKGSLNLYGGAIAGNASTTTGSGGGGVLVYAGGVFHMYGGAIRANKADWCGGGVYVYTASDIESPPLDKGRFYLHGGQISGNYAAMFGGGVFNEGVFHMEDGDIAGNTAAMNGGGLWAASFTLSGGEITGNYAGASAGGAYMDGYDSDGFVLQDSPVITGNTAGVRNTVGNLWFQNDQTVTVGDGGLTGDAKIGVSSARSTVPALFPINLTGNNSADYSAFFVSDDYSRIIRKGENNVVQLALLPTPSATGYKTIAANGAPLLLVAGRFDATKTVVYIDRDNSGTLTDADKIFNPNIGNATDGTVAGNDLRRYAVIGGGVPYSTVTGDTRITMTGGQVSGIYGGGDGDVVGDTRVTVEDGSVGYLYGGGYGKVTGNTSVTVEGGQVGYLYGGGEGDPFSPGSGTVTNDADITVAGGKVTYLYGGGEDATVGGKRTVTVGGGAKVGSAEESNSGVAINGGTGDGAELNGVSRFAIGSPLTGGNGSVCVVLPGGFDASLKPIIANGASQDDLAKIKLVGDGAKGKEAYFENNAIKVRAKSADATLSALSYTVESGRATAVPNFAADTFTYDVTLPHSTAQNAAITLTGTVNHSKATVTENNGVTLSGGSGAATVKVTAEDGAAVKTYTVNFTVAPAATYSISGVIKGSDTGNGIAAALQLKDSAGENIGGSVAADEDGTYAISGVSAGTYSIEVSCPGYDSGTIDGVTVSNANVANQDLTLNKTEEFIPVASISMTSAATVEVNTDLTLTGAVAPVDASNQAIIWSVANANGTGATVNGGVFRATAPGTVTVKADIADGLAVGTPFTREFSISVTSPYNGGSTSGGDDSTPGGSFSTAPFTTTKTTATDDGGSVTKTETTAKDGKGKTTTVTTEVIKDASGNVTGSATTVTTDNVTTSVDQGNLTVSVRPDASAINSASSAVGASSTNPLDITVALPQETVKNELRREDVSTVGVEVVLPKSVEDNPAVGNVGVTVEQEAVEAARQTEKSINVTVREDTGAVKAVWSLDGRTMKNAAGQATDLILSVHTSPVQSQDPIADPVKPPVTAAGYGNGLVISFTADGTLLSAAKLTVPATGQTGITAGSTVILYRFDKNTGTLSPTPVGVYGVDANGNVTINVPAGVRTGARETYVLLTSQETAGAETEAGAGTGTYIRHMIRKGDTLLQLSRQYGCRVEDLLALNPGVEIYNLQIGSHINLPIK